MKHLNNDTIKNLNNDTKVKLKILNSFLQSCGISENNKVDNYINRLYNTYIRSTAKNNDNSNIKYFDKLENWLGAEGKMANDNKTIHINAFIRSVKYLCYKYTCYNEIFNLMNDQLKDKDDSFYHLELDDVIKKQITLDDIYNYYKDSYNIPKAFFDELLEIESAGQPSVGKGEFLLRLISKPVESNKYEADIIINNVGVEVKSIIRHECKLGNASKGSVEPIFNFLNKFLDEKTQFNINKKFPSISVTTNFNTNKYREIGQKFKLTLTNLKNEIINKKKTKKDIAALLNDEIINSFYKDGTIIEKTKYNDICDIVVDMLINLELIDLNTNNTENEFKFMKELIKIFTVLYIIVYCIEEDAKYLCYIDNKYIFNFLKVSNDTKTFEDIYKLPDLPVYQIRHSGAVNSIQLK